MYELVLEDFFFGKSFKVKVESLKEGSKLFRANRDLHNVGASDYRHRESGNVLKNGEVIAHISYNGRVWDLEDNEIKI